MNNLNISLVKTCKTWTLKHCKRLIESGVNISNGDNLPFRLSTRFDKLDVAKYLLDNGADINCCGGMPILMLVFDNRAKSTKFLIDNGANFRKNNDEVIRVAFEKNRRDILLLLLDEYKYISIDDLYSLSKKHM